MNTNGIVGLSGWPGGLPIYTFVRHGCKYEDPFVPCQPERIVDIAVIVVVPEGQIDYVDFLLDSPL